jgi:hypothetical protein
MLITAAHSTFPFTLGYVPAAIPAQRSA